MAKKIFITATGTDVGKTYISALIIKKMRESGLDCGYYKPVLSGVEEKNGKLTESDCNYVVSTAKIPATADECVTYWWKEAVSPHLAAQRAGQIIETEKIKRDFDSISQKYDYLLIEGAGGITCPLRLESEKYLLKDLIKELNSDIIVVADAGLGTINSTLLTVEYAKNNGINIQGIILNKYDDKNFMHIDNLDKIEYLSGVKVVATIPENADEIKLLDFCFV